MTTSDRVYADVKNRVMTGRLRPGEPLRERDLAQELGVSRTPVREALGRLEAEGLVVRGPRATLMVAQPTLSDVFDLFDLREVVEGLAARRAAERATRHEVEALLAAAQEVDGPGATHEGELEFHRMLVALARQTQLTRTFQAESLVQYALVLAIAVDPSTDNRGQRHTHTEVAQAILEGAPAVAEQAARDHVRAARELLEAYVTSHPDRRRELLRELPALSVSGQDAGRALAPVH